MSRTATGEWDSLLERDAIRQPDAQFELLVQRQSRFVFRIAYVILRNAHDAEDVTQDTFFKLFRTGAWKRMEDEKAFLAKVAWRLATSKAQAARSRPEPAEPAEIPSAEYSPERAAIDAECTKIIHRLIDALPEKLRRPLALSATGELTASEIALVVGLPQGTVRRLLMEARALVKEKIVRMEGNNRA